MSRASGRVAVVISGFNTRAVLAFLRLADARGDRVVVVGRASQDPIDRTRHVARVVARIGRELQVDEVVAALGTVRAVTGLTPVIVPITEFLNRWLLDHREAIEATGAVVPLSSVDSYLALSDKGSFDRLCQDHGLPTPELHADVATAPLPFAAKPVAELSSAGLARRPVMVHSEADRDRVLADQEPWLAQHYIAGESRYLLVHRSRDGSFQRDRQRNGAQQGGGGSVVWAWRTPAWDLDLESALCEVLEHLDHVGPAMFEVKVADGCPYVIECNPRPWGPLQLLVDANSPVVHAWLDDLFGVPSPAWPQDRRSPSYSWIGGMLAARRDGRGLTWFENDRRRWWFLAAVVHDVHLRRDSLRLFVAELMGRS